jgi:hypothetical protein
MAELDQCPSFWTENPQVLFDNAKDFFPFSEEARNCSTIALNSLTRFSIYLGILLVLLTRNNIYLGIPVLGSILAIGLFYNMKSQGTLRKGTMPTLTPSIYEGFSDESDDKNTSLIFGTNADGKVLEDIIGKTIRTTPTSENPFMNVLINEIGDYPSKPPAKYNASGDVKQKIEDRFELKMYGDPGDFWGRNQSQREFYTTPSTSIPNDRDSFQNWLYRVPGKTCKEGNNAACVPATNGDPLQF